MKALEYYMSLPYKMELIEDVEEGGYTIFFPELPGCITCGDTIEEAIKNAKDAKKEWLVSCLEDEIPITEPDGARKYSGQFKLRIPKSLHRSLVEHSKQEGISVNQYCVYLLSKNDSLYSRPQ